VLPAGTYPVPYGYTTTATLAADEGWNIKSVKLGAEELVAVEGVYTLPAIKADATLTIEVEQIMVNLTVAAFEHATLTVEGVGVTVAGTYPVPYGYTTTATIAVEEGYKLTSVKLGEEELIPVEGVYTIPALTEDAVVTIIVEEDEGTGLDQVSANVCRKVVRDGQVIIIRNGKDYNVLGF
jgi:predicted RecA/RadA family phage recombinase